MKFDIHGEGAETVVLSSGLGGVAGYWAPQIATLAERFRVITYDQRGCGRTGGTVPVGTTIADMAADLAEVLDASGTACAHVIGHALGGLIGMELALAAPDRVASILAINAWAKTSPHSLRCFEARLRLLDQSVEAFIRAQPLFLYPAEWMEQNEARMAAEDAHHIAHFQGETNIRRRIAAIAAFDITDRAKHIACPVLALATRDDLLVPFGRSKALASLLPDAELALMNFGAHAVNVTEPALFNARMSAFLQAKVAQIAL